MLLQLASYIVGYSSTEMIQSSAVLVLDIHYMQLYSIAGKVVEEQRGGWVCQPWSGLVDVLRGMVYGSMSANGGLSALWHTRSQLTANLLQRLEYQASASTLFLYSIY